VIGESGQEEKTGVGDQGLGGNNRLGQRARNPDHTNPAKNSWKGEQRP